MIKQLQNIFAIWVYVYDETKGIKSGKSQWGLHFFRNFSFQRRRINQSKYQFGALALLCQTATGWMLFPVWVKLMCLQKRRDKSNAVLQRICSKSNAVFYHLPKIPKHRKPGRPKKYGDRLDIRRLRYDLCQLRISFVVFHNCSYSGINVKYAFGIWRERFPNRDPFVVGNRSSSYLKAVRYRKSFGIQTQTRRTCEI